MNRRRYVLSGRHGFGPILLGVIITCIVGVVLVGTSGCCEVPRCIKVEDRVQSELYKRPNKNPEGLIDRADYWLCNGKRFERINEALDYCKAESIRCNVRLSIFGYWLRQGASDEIYQRVGIRELPDR